MMKKLIVLLAVMVMVSAVAAYAGPNDNWMLTLKAASSTGTNSGGNLTIGTATGADDLYDSANDAPGGAPTTAQAYIRSYSDLGAAAPLAPNGWLADYKAPIESGMKTWSDIEIGAGTAWGGTTTPVIRFSIWNSSSYDLLPSAKIRFKVLADDGNVLGANTLAVNSGKYSGTYLILNPNATTDVDKVTFDTSKNGTSSSPAYKFDLASATLKSGGLVKFAVEAEVPEPGSMVAMLSGLVGLVGYGIRRRK